MNTITMNKNNWSGEEAIFSYSDSGAFELYDYQFHLDVKLLGDNAAVVKLIGEGWDEPLDTIYFAGKSRLEHLSDEYSLEEAIRRAAVYIFNHV